MINAKPLVVVDRLLDLRTPAMHGFAWQAISPDDLTFEARDGNDRWVVMFRIGRLVGLRMAVKLKGWGFLVGEPSITADDATRW